MNVLLICINLWNLIFFCGSDYLKLGLYEGCLKVCGFM